MFLLHTLLSISYFTFHQPYLSALPYVFITLTTFIHIFQSPFPPSFFFWLLFFYCTHYFSKTPHSRIKFPNIKNPINAAAVIRDILFKLTFPKILVFKLNSSSDFFSFFEKKDGYVFLHSRRISGLATGTSLT